MHVCVWGKPPPPLQNIASCRCGLYVSNKDTVHSQMSEKEDIFWHCKTNTVFLSTHQHLNRVPENLLTRMSFAKPPFSVFWNTICLSVKGQSAKKKHFKKKYWCVCVDKAWGASLNNQGPACPGGRDQNQQPSPISACYQPTNKKAHQKIQANRVCVCVLLWPSGYGLHLMKGRVNMNCVRSDGVKLCNWRATRLITAPLSGAVCVCVFYSISVYST